MRIARIRTHLLNYEMPAQYRRGSSMGVITHRNTFLVEVETDDGVVGWGEAYDSGPAGHRAVRAFIEESYAPTYIGASPFDSAVLWEECFHRHRAYGISGPAIEALSALDIALWDLKGKLTGQPVANLLGGRFRDQIRMYATGVYMAEDDNPTATAIADMQAYADRGFRSVKMGGGYGVEVDIARARAVREAMGPDFWLAIDANRGYAFKDALRLAKALEPLDFAWFEEPMMAEDAEGFAALRAQTTVPIAGAELIYTRFGFREVVERGLLDIVQPDMTAVGGYTEMQRILALCQAHHVTVTPHGWVSAVGLFANLQLAAAIPTFPLRWRPPEFILELDSIHNPLRDELAEGPIPLEKDVATVPQRPGIGVTPRRDVIARYEVDPR